MKMPGKIIAVKPAASLVLIETLNSQEMIGSTLTISRTSEVGTPQAYILAIGPAVDHEKLGFKVGDRILVQGKYVPVPSPAGHERELGLIEVSSIKGVIEEEGN